MYEVFHGNVRELLGNKRFLGYKRSKHRGHAARMEELKAEKANKGETRTSLFHLLAEGRKNPQDAKIVLQRLIVIARLPQHLADRAELGAHYEKLHFQLSKQFIRDHMTGLLLIYPSCLLFIVESSRQVLMSVLKDMQQPPGCTFLETPKVMFLAHNPLKRLFQQWSYKLINTDQRIWNITTKGLGEEDESTETLVCTVLSALKKLGEHIETHNMALPGSALDKTPELIVSQNVLAKLLARDDLMTTQQHLQMYNSPLNISVDFGQFMQSRNLNSV
ncbi:testis-expressed protein 47 [Brachionichthys hirsutus]|uniref:testis-expressed protein 47 n=1 Tax=Brachionichthys hirsutus TaxID=412623 RepID=UPI003604B125